MTDAIGATNHFEGLAAQAQLSQTQAQLEGASAQADAGRDGEAKEALEGLFAKMLVKEMRRGLGEGFFGSGPGAENYAEWLDDHLADSLVQGGAVDLSELLENLTAQRVAAAESPAAALAQEAELAEQAESEVEL